MINHCATFCVSVPLSGYLLSFDIGFSQSFYASNRVHCLFLNFLGRPDGESRWFLSPRQQNQHLWAHRVCKNFRNKFPSSSEGIHKYFRLSIFRDQYNAGSRLSYAQSHDQNVCREYTHKFIYFLLFIIFIGDICFCVYLLYERTHSDTQIKLP